MASTFYLYCDALNIKHRVVQKYADYTESDKKLFFSAVAIQRAWRGYTTRKIIKNWNSNAIVIQKYVRGWLVRLKLPEFLKDYYQQLSVLFYDKQATKIQALWKGYQVKQIAGKNFRSVKDILAEREEIRLVNEEMRDQIHKLFEELRSGPWNEFRENQRKVLEILMDKHHLLRTRQLEGVFSIHGSFELSEIEKILRSFPLKGYMDAVHAIKKSIKTHN